MVELTPEQREITGAVVSQVQSVGWSGDITPHIDAIVSVIGRLIAQDPKFKEFAEVIYNQATQWSLAAWSENLVPNLADSGWSRLRDRLKEFTPSP